MNELYFNKLEARVRLGPFGSFILIEQEVGKAVEIPSSVRIADLEKSPPIMNYFVTNEDEGADGKLSPMITI
jgi:hypothetical protein